jgi:hypothetical protein
MTRPTRPARATQALVAELRAQGVRCSPRQLEDWRRTGLIPRGHRRSLGRGRGTEVVYPDDMVERCLRVAERMRRGQPWQVVALSLFAASAELPEETVRAAYRWALRIKPSGDEDELDAAARGVDQLLATVAGRRLRALVTSQVKRSGVARGEAPGAVAASVLTNLLVVALGGEVADDTAMIELLAGIGLPIAELPPDEQLWAARFMDAVLGACSMDELVEVAEDASLEELRSAVPAVVQLLRVVPGELRALVPRSAAELLPALLAPVVLQLRHIGARLLADAGAPDHPTAAARSQARATMEAMPFPHAPGQTEPEVRSA